MSTWYLIPFEKRRKHTSAKATRTTSMYVPPPLKNTLFILSEHPLPLTFEPSFLPRLSPLSSPLALIYIELTQALAHLFLVTFLSKSAPCLVEYTGRRGAR